MPTVAQIGTLALALCLLCGALLALRKAKQQRELAARAMASLLTLKQAAQTMSALSAEPAILDAIARPLAPDGFSLHQWTPERKVLSLRLSQGLSTAAVAQLSHLEIGQGPCPLPALAERDHELLIPDLRDPAIAWPHAALADEFRTLWAAPLLWAGQQTGVMALWFKQARSASPSDVALLNILACQAGLALERAELARVDARRARELAALSDIASISSTELDIAVAAQRAAQTIQQMLHPDHLHIILQRQAGQQLDIQIAYGDQIERIPSPFPEGIVRSVLDTGRPALVPDVSLDARYHQIIPETRSELCVPLQVGGKVLGAINVESDQPSAFSDQDLQWLCTIGAQLGSMVENVLQYQQASRRAEQLQVINEIGQDIAAILDVGRIMSHVVRGLRDRLHHYDANILLLDSQGSELVWQAGTRIDAAQAQPDSLRCPLGRGIIGRAAERRQPLYVSDVHQDPGYWAMPEIPDTRSEVAVPIQIGDRLLGILDVQSTQVDAYTQDDVFALESLTNQLAISLENARLYQETERRLAETSLLCNLTQHTTSTLALEQVLNSIVEQLRTVISCRAITIFLLDKTGEDLTIAAASGVKPEFRERTRIKVGEGVSGVVFQQERPMYVRDVPREAPDLGSDPTIHSLLVVPLIAKSKVIGTLSVDSTQIDAFPPEHERLLTIVAAQAASSIENAQLYEAERQRAEELERAYQDLKELDRMKSQFVQNISHELRTPLTFVKGYADLLAEEAMGKLSEQQKRSVDIIAQKTDAITRLVNDIITLQEIETMPTQKDLVSLGDVLGMVVDTARATASSRGLELRKRALPARMWIMADDDRLIQVFDNLLGNALKFTQSGGAIEVSAQDDGDCWRVSVRDTGIGIPSDKLEKVFERFYQVDGSTTRRFGGTGLGLAIAKEIVLNHGGRIWAESALGQGSTFHVALPKCPGPDD